MAKSAQAGEGGGCTPTPFRHHVQSCGVRSCWEGSYQRVTKRCRLSWLTNIALICKPKWGGGGVRGLGQWVQLYTGAQINFEDLTPSFTYGRYTSLISTLPQYALCVPGQMKKTSVYFVSWNCPFIRLRICTFKIILTQKIGVLM